MQTHGGRLPPNAAHPPSLATQFADPASWHRIDAKGYAFDLDALSRTRKVTGTLASNPNQGRSRSSQRTAGGRDRLPGDEGGHYIARRFDGPTQAFNHFAQNGNFNKSAYLGLENRWAAAQKLGKKV